MKGNITPVVSRTKLGAPVLVPPAAIAAALLVVLGLGLTVGWMAARGWASAPPPAPQPAPVIVAQRCPAPDPVVPAPAAARAPAQAQPVVARAQPVPAQAQPALLQAQLNSEPPRSPSAALPAPAPPAAARAPRIRMSRAVARSSAGGDSWEPAPM